MWGARLNITQFLQANGVRYALVLPKEFVRGARSPLGFDGLYGSKHIRISEFCFAFSVWIRAAGESAPVSYTHLTLPTIYSV